MRLLRFLSKSHGWSGSLAQLGREFGMDDSNLRDPLEALVSQGFIQDEKSHYRLTPKGKRKIAFLWIPNYLIMTLFVISFFPFYWAWFEIEFRQPVLPLSFIVIAFAMLTLSGTLWFLVRKSEKWFW
jgi:hypothetical protein